MIRKRILSETKTSIPHELNLEDLAEFELSSEDPSHTLENALRPDSSVWSAATEGEQWIRLKFVSPQNIRDIHLRFDEPRAERTQEFLLLWLLDGETAWREVRRQQFNFDPRGAVTEVERIEVNIRSVRCLELRIRPRIGGGGIASLTFLAMTGVEEYR